ncbi:MAG: 4'-phosphopantetheinyl transferase superfamily protein [Niabella sp.]
MPVFFQQDINATTKLGIWKIEEEETFFKQLVPLHRDVTHRHKRLQHLAGRFLLKYLFPGFPSHLVQIADTRKPFLENEAFHFSISHCGDYAAAIVSSTNRVGIDIEIPVSKVPAIQHKFMSAAEKSLLNPETLDDFTKIWSAKEAVFKWYGKGAVDFKQHIRLLEYRKEGDQLKCFFAKTQTELNINLALFPGLALAYLYTKV